MEDVSHLKSMSEPPLTVVGGKEVGSWPKGSVLKVFPDSREQDLDELLKEVDEYQDIPQSVVEPTPVVDLEADHEVHLELNEKDVEALHQVADELDAENIEENLEVTEDERDETKIEEIADVKVDDRVKEMAAEPEVERLKEKAEQAFLGININANPKEEEIKVQKEHTGAQQA